MDGQFITLAEVLHYMDSGRAFDIEAVKCDTKRGTGGALARYPRHVKYLAQRLTQKEAAKAQAIAGGRHPGHFENSTRNIYDPQRRKMSKVHIRLITRFNGKIVL